MFRMVSRRGRALLLMAVLAMLSLFATAASAAGQLPGRPAMPMTPPVVTSGTTVSVPENTGSDTGTVVLTVTDDASTPLDALSGSVTDGLVSCTFTATFGSCVYTPNVNFVGTDTLTYSASDSSGGTLTGTVTIDVTSAVTVLPAQSVSTPENTPVTVPTDVTVEAGDTVTVDVSSFPLHGSATCTVNSCTYTPQTGFIGTDSFQFTAICTTASDTSCGSATGTVNITVFAEAPIGPVGTVALQTGENIPKHFIPPVTPGASSNFTYFVSTQAGHGYVYCQYTTPPPMPALPCTYYPHHDFHGFDTFAITVTDGNGNSIVVQFQIRVVHIDQPPDTSQPMNLIISENTTGYIDVLTYSHDPDHRDRMFVTTPTPPAAHGTVSCYPHDGCYYHPDINYVGPDSFIFTIDDGHAETVTGTVNITVRAAPTP
jgi:hypothetical protein